jgi:hypothetical protein
MGLVDRLIVNAKNLATRAVDLVDTGGNYILSITEYGRTRNRTLLVEDVVYLQKCLWFKKAVQTGIILNFYPHPDELYQRFEVPNWAMERLRDDLLNNRIHLNVN